MTGAAASWPGSTSADSTLSDRGSQTLSIVSEIADLGRGDGDGVMTGAKFVDSGRGRTSDLSEGLT